MSTTTIVAEVRLVAISARKYFPILFWLMCFEMPPHSALLSRRLGTKRTNNRLDVLSEMLSTRRQNLVTPVNSWQSRICHAITYLRSELVLNGPSEQFSSGCQLGQGQRSNLPDRNSCFSIRGIGVSLNFDGGPPPCAAEPDEPCLAGSQTSTTGSVSCLGLGCPGGG